LLLSAVRGEGGRSDEARSSALDGTAYYVRGHSGLSVEFCASNHHSATNEA
jgi:hypothetical protein